MKTRIIVEWFEYSFYKNISENIIEFTIHRSCDINSDFILHSSVNPETIQVLIGNKIVKELDNCTHIKIDIPILALIFETIQIKAM